MNYYVYLHIKEKTGEPFYVGKGKDGRAYSKHNRSQYWKRIYNKYGFDVILLETNLSEKESLEKEIYWIKKIGRENLCNMTDGGEGTSGKIPWNKGCFGCQKNLSGGIKKIVLDMNTGIFYDSITEAAKAYNKSRISRMLSGERKNKTNLKLV
jgi:hypothetical protein